MEGTTMLMKTVRFYQTKKNGARRLHIETEGCIVNIVAGLRDLEGRRVTRVDVQCDQYAGDPKNTMPDYDNAQFLGVRVVQELPPAKEPIGPGVPLNGGPVTPRFRRAYTKELKHIRKFGY
jgi:hypothetical protein